MKIKIMTLLLIFLVTDIITAQEKSELIGDRIVAFYPADYISWETQPSLALIGAPDSLGPIPENWTIIPQFAEITGKNGAVIDIEDDTDLYGTGEVVGDLKRNNTEVTLWNTDNYGYWKEDGKQLYQSHPWILAVRADGSAYGILIDHSWKQTIYLTDPISIVSDGPPFRILIIERDSPQEVLMSLAELTGKMDLPPLWALGYHQCRYSYYPQSEVIELAETFREKDIPCDVIWMDIDYMDKFKVFTFDPVGFPSPQFVNTFLHSLDFRSIWMIDPGVKYEPGYFVYDQGTAQDVWVKNTSGSVDYQGDVWPGSCVFPDFTRPETRTWWSGLYQDFMATGIDGIWNDMNEPAVFSENSGTMPVTNLHRGGGSLPADIHLRYHNLYGMLMVKASREGILQANPDKRPFVLTRANFLGGHRYAATWTGDNISSFEHLKMSIPMSINLGLSGQPFSGPDIGGFAGDCTADLLGQWMAVGAFYPFSRNHSGKGSVRQEPWAFGTTIEKVSRTALKRRYALLPYFYTLFRQASETGLPVMQPLFFADVTDPALRDEQEVFLLGNDLMVIPAWSHPSSFPEGKWRSVELLDENEMDNYQARLKQRHGSVIPLTGEDIQTTASFDPEKIKLLIAPNNDQEASGYLYVDAGEGFDYRNGAFEWNRIEVTPSDDDSLQVKIVLEEGNHQSDTRQYLPGLVTNYGVFYQDWKSRNRFKIPRYPDLFIELVSPENGQHYEQNSIITLQVALDGDLPLEKIVYKTGSGTVIGESTTAPWSFDWVDAPTGEFAVSAHAISPDGYEVVSDALDISVGDFGSGEITYQQWFNIGTGVEVIELTSNPNYPDSPDEESYLTSFETPYDIGDDFGARIIGYLHPPNSGLYNFSISGDDYCELWLSENESLQDLIRIAHVPGWTSPGEWTKYIEQRSQPVYLSNEKKYLIMGLQKEAGGHDHLAVAWEYDGNAREIIDGFYLSPDDGSSNAGGVTENTFSIYPNPASDHLLLNAKNLTGTVSMFDAKGSLVYEKTLSGKATPYKIDLAAFEKGMYMVTIKTSNNKVFSKKVLVLD